MRKLFLTIHLFVTAFSFAQNKQIDSLKTILKTAGQDTTRVNTLSELSQLFAGNNPDTALILGNQVLVLAQKLNYKIGEAKAEYNIGRSNYFKQNGEEALLHLKKALGLTEDLLSSKNQADVQSAKKLLVRVLGTIANVYGEKEDFPNALEYYFKSLKMAEVLGDRRMACYTIVNIASVYLVQANYPKALECCLKALKLAEEVGDKKQVGRIFGALANVFYEQADFPKALEYLHKGLKISEEAGDNIMVGRTLGNIASVYKGLGDFPKAMDFHLKALTNAEEAGDKALIGITLGNMANIYKDQLDYRKALDYYFRGLKIAEETEDKQLICLAQGNIGALYTEMGKQMEAEFHLKKALSIAQEIGAEDLQNSQHQSLSILYEKSNRPALALKHYKKFIALRDTIFSQENSKKLMRSEMNFEFEKQKAVADAKHKSDLEKQNAVAAEKERKQKVITYSVVAGLLFVLVFAVFIYRSNRQKHKANQIITQQKNEVESQKHLIEEKHKEITDSINYAERIQRSFIATKEILDENLNDYFVLFKPKDVVSGDFYWASKLNNGNFALATADSTGHGVPGAIMSLLNITSLEKAIETFIEPYEILNSTRKTIIERLKKDGSENGGKDGMDASLTVYDFKNKKLIVAAANNPVWIVRGAILSHGEVRGFDSAQPDDGIEVIEIKADKMPVGKHDKDNVSFTQQEIQLQTGDVVYTLTDGFPDQFGGEKGKKFMSKNLRELLAANSHLPMHEQKQLLQKTFANWVGDLEQVDDVTIIGVRV